MSIYYARKVRRTVWKRLRLLWLLWCVSRMYPTQRFGQIIVNYVTRSGSTLFHREDWQIIGDLKEEIHRRK